MGLPVLSAVLLGALLLFSLWLPLQATAHAQGARGRGVPARFWCYAAFAVLYGVCETMNGNWSQLVMTTRAGAVRSSRPPLPDRVTYHLLPLVLLVSFTLVAALPSRGAAAGIAVFGLAGLGCSALLPLTISFGERELTAMSGAIAGAIIACYQVGYGLAAFGVGPLQRAGLSLSAIFGVTAIAAAALAVLSLVVARGRRALAGSRPRLTPAK